jgi:hypothetical protein
MLMAFTSCRDEPKSARDIHRSPQWVTTPPKSRTHFVGVGSTAVEHDIESAHETAQKRAVQQIVEQIESAIISDINMHKNSLRNNNTGQIARLYREKIESITTDIISHWQERATWHDPEGYYWSMVVMEKKQYNRQIRQKVDSTISFCVTALNAASHGSLQKRLSTLYQALYALDNFLGIPMEVSIDRKKVILNAAIPRAISELYKNISIVPNVGHVVLDPLQPSPDTIGAFVVYNDSVEHSVSLRWEATDERIRVTTPAPPDSSGLHRVLIESLPPSAGPIEIAAVLITGQVKRKLDSCNIDIPEGSFTAERRKPVLFASGKNQFTHSVVKRLSEIECVVVAETKDSAELYLNAQVSVDNSGSVKKQPAARYSVRLVDIDGKKVLETTGEVTGGAAENTNDAVEAAFQQAIEHAARHIENSF